MRMRGVRYEAALLGGNIRVWLAADVSAEIRSRLDEALLNINAHAGDLESGHGGILGRLKSIRVDAKAKRCFVLERSAALTLTPGYIEACSAAFIGSAIAHDAFHVEQFRAGGVAGSRGVDAEREAFAFQLDFGRRIGIAEYEAEYLRGLIEDPDQLRDYFYSEIR